MNKAALLMAPVLLVLGGLGTGAVRRMAQAHGLLDVPNERSSHSAVVPRGGGAAIVVTTTLGLSVLLWLKAVDIQLYLALAIGGGAVAAVGFLDDRHSLSARWRLAVHVLAALWAVYLVGGLGAEHVRGGLIYPGWVGTGLAVLGVVWVVNLFNFMDGIDGLAGSEALFVAAAGALLASAGGASGIASAAWIFAWVCAGFLAWNWPPARVFLGDVGSGYLGYVVIVLALAHAAARPGAIWVWFILGALFFVDSTLTLLRRLLRGDRVHEAHRQHAYQRLSRRWGSHRNVTLLAVAINLVWLFPLAYLALQRPCDGVWLAAMAVLPLLLGSVWLGAGGRRD
jgi:Fuc2NAc and GlcNAc transferase